MNVSLHTNKSLSDFVYAGSEERLCGSRLVLYSALFEFISSGSSSTSPGTCKGLPLFAKCTHKHGASVVLKSSLQASPSCFFLFSFPSFLGFSMSFLALELLFVLLFGLLFVLGILVFLLL